MYILIFAIPTNFDINNVCTFFTFADTIVFHKARRNAWSSSINKGMDSLYNFWWFSCQFIYCLSNRAWKGTKFYYQEHIIINRGNCDKIPTMHVVHWNRWSPRERGLPVVGKEGNVEFYCAVAEGITRGRSTRAAVGARVVLSNQPQSVRCTTAVRNAGTLTLHENR